MDTFYLFMATRYLDKYLPRGPILHHLCIRESGKSLVSIINIKSSFEAILLDHFYVPRRMRDFSSSLTTGRLSRLPSSSSSRFVSCRRHSTDWTRLRWRLKPVKKVLITYLIASSFQRQSCKQEKYLKWFVPCVISLNAFSRKSH